MRWSVEHADCCTFMAAMAASSVDAVVCDPPYRIGFMGKAWDAKISPEQAQAWHREWAKQALRVLKPGGHLLAFGGSRTVHRLACGVEDAGFEIRDQIAWVYGSGFAKSKHVLKPAVESIVVGRRPLVGTVASNVLAYGTGAMNVGKCRVALTGESRERINEASQDRRYTDRGATDLAAKPGIRGGHPVGRWPANFIHDGSDEVLALFPITTSGSGGVKRQSSKDGYGNRSTAFGAESRREGTLIDSYADTGSAARFFYCAKASPAERAQYGHPTQKPVALMRYLCRLVTPPGGLVLDPFAGTGTTGVAALMEGFRFVGIEQDAGYAANARTRLGQCAVEYPVMKQPPPLPFV